MSNTTDLPSFIIRRQALAFDSLQPELQHAKTIEIHHCTSDAWGSVAKTLASFEQLKSLSLVHCNCDDTLCQELVKSKSILRLRLGISLAYGEYCGISDEGVQKITEMDQLEELVLGILSNHRRGTSCQDREGLRECVYASH